MLIAADSMLLATLWNSCALGPCTAEAVLALLDFTRYPLRERLLRLLVAPNVIGRPVAALLSAKTLVTVCLQTRTLLLRLSSQRLWLWPQVVRSVGLTT